MKKYIFGFSAVLLLLFSIIACSQPVSTKLSLCSLSNESGYSDVMKKTLGKLRTDCDTVNDITPESVPDIVIVKGSDINSKGTPEENNKMLADLARVVLHGKNLIIDQPAVENLFIFAFGSNMLLSYGDDPDDPAYSLIPDLAELRNLYNADPANGLQNLFAEIDWEKLLLDHGEDLEDKTKLYDAVGVRLNQTYYVHPVENEVIVEFESEAYSSESVSTEANPGSSINETTGSDDKDDDSNYDDLVEGAAANFVRWIEAANDPLLKETRLSEKDKAEFSVLTKGNLDDLIAANTYYHNFTASANSKHFSDRSENVELVNDVWSGCDMANQKDYFLVHTRVSANNDQLKYNNGNSWGKNKRVGPYFKLLTIEQSISKDNQTIRDESPQNASGSTNFTTSSGWNIGGNVGITAKGPTAGISGGYSCSKSSSTSIPDISVKYQKSGNHAIWTFEGGTPDHGWHGLKTFCDNAKSIQTNRATFDTYAVYVIPSGYNYPAHMKDYVELSTWPKVEIDYLDGKLSGFLNTTLTTTRYYCTTSRTFNDYVPKPCHSKDNFIMYFNAPAEVDTDKVSSLLKEYFKDWNSNVDFWAVWGDELDDVAKNTLRSTTDRIKKNKDVLASRGFPAGTYSFHIKRSNSSTNLDSVTITF